MGLLPTEWRNLVKGFSKRLAGEGLVGVFPVGNVVRFSWDFTRIIPPFCKGRRGGVEPVARSNPQAYWEC